MYQEGKDIHASMATCDGASQQWTYRFLEVFSMLKFMEEEVRATRSRPSPSRVS